MPMFYLALWESLTGEVPRQFGLGEDRDSQRIETIAVHALGQTKSALALLMQHGNIECLGTDLDATVFQNEQACSPDSLPL